MGCAVRPSRRRCPAARAADRGERFDELVLETVRDIDTRRQDWLGLVEYAVEDTPQLPDDWSGETVPLPHWCAGRAPPRRDSCCSVARSSTGETRADPEAMVLTVVVEQVASCWASTPRRSTRYPRED